MTPNDLKEVIEQIEDDAIHYAQNLDTRITADKEHQIVLHDELEEGDKEFLLTALMRSGIKSDTAEDYDFIFVPMFSRLGLKRGEFNILRFVYNNDFLSVVRDKKI